MNLNNYKTLEVLSDGKQEPALTVDDAHQGLGVGSLLLKHIVAIAQERGIIEFVADVLPENKKMLKLLDHFGLPVMQSIEHDVVRLVLLLSDTQSP